MEKYKLKLAEIEDWLKNIIQSLEPSLSSDEIKPQEKIDHLQGILEQLEEKEKIAKEIQKDCESYGSQYGDVQKFVYNLLAGLNVNITVIRENQDIIRNSLLNLNEAPKEKIVETEAPKEIEIIE